MGATAPPLGRNLEAIQRMIEYLQMELFLAQTTQLVQLSEEEEVQSEQNRTLIQTDKRKVVGVTESAYGQVTESVHPSKRERVERSKERTVFDHLGDKAPAKGVVEHTRSRQSCTHRPPAQPVKLPPLNAQNITLPII